MGPRIGIPLCLDTRGRWNATRDYHYIDASYARAIENAGATPFYLPLQSDPEALIGQFDGLLLPGGDDLLPPDPYPSGVEFDPVPESQLRFDSALLAAAVERGTPVLAICYGMQLLALSAGGSLHYDIPTDLPEAGVHRIADSGGRHPVEIEPNSRLARALGAGPICVNSLHHQVILWLFCYGKFFSELYLPDRVPRGLYRRNLSTVVEGGAGLKKLRRGGPPDRL